MWLPPRTRSSSAPGMSSAIRRESQVGVKRSRSPATTRRRHVDLRQVVLRAVLGGGLHRPEEEAGVHLLHVGEVRGQVVAAEQMGIDLQGHRQLHRQAGPDAGPGHHPRPPGGSARSPGAGRGGRGAGAWCRGRCRAGGRGSRRPAPAPGPGPDAGGASPAPAARPCCGPSPPPPERPGGVEDGRQVVGELGNGGRAAPQAVAAASAHVRGSASAPPGGDWRARAARYFQAKPSQASPSQRTTAGRPRPSASTKSSAPSGRPRPKWLAWPCEGRLGMARGVTGP